MPQEQIASLKQVNLQIQNDMEELEQCDRRLSLGLMGYLSRRKEEARMFLNML